MGVLDSFGALVSSVLAVIVMLVLAVISFYITVFIVDTGAALAGYTSVDGGFVSLSAAVLVAGAIVAGASPLSAVAGAGES